MGLRFRKSVKILPGVRLNFSKSGVSATVGRRGASVSVGKRGVYGNAGIPGTGLGWRERLDRRGREARPMPRAARTPGAPGVVLPFIGFYLLFSAVSSLFVSSERMPAVALFCLLGAGGATWWRRRAYLEALRERGGSG